jgi:hypothetical protein
MTYLNGIVHSHRKINNFFWQLEMFDLCTTGDTSHVDKIFKFLPHTRQHGRIHTLIHTLASPSGRNVNYDRKKTTFWGKTFLSYSFNLYRFRKYVSCGLPIINFCNPGVHHDTPCISGESLSSVQLTLIVKLYIQACFNKNSRKTRLVEKFLDRRC